jgi:hypothetical protein
MFFGVENILCVPQAFDQATSDPVSLTLHESRSGWQKVDLTEAVKQWLSESGKEKLRLPGGLQLLQQLARAPVQHRGGEEEQSEPAVPRSPHGPQHGAAGEAARPRLLGGLREPVLQAALLRQLQAAGLGRLGDSPAGLPRQLLQGRLRTPPDPRHLRHLPHARDRGGQKDSPPQRDAALLRPAQVL